MKSLVVVSTVAICLSMVSGCTSKTPANVSKSDDGTWVVVADACVHQSVVSADGAVAKGDCEAAPAPKIKLTAVETLQDAAGQETAPSNQCKDKSGFVLLTRSEDALRLAYAMWMAGATPGQATRYGDEASFKQNFTASLVDCKWEVQEKGQHGIFFMEIDAVNGALLKEGSAE